MIKVVKENLTGLLRFAGLLIKSSKKVEQAPRGVQSEHIPPGPGIHKYDGLLHQPSMEYLGGTVPYFCPVCHCLVCHTRRTRQGTQIIRNGRVQITVKGNMATDSEGKQRNGLALKCPRGHIVRIE